MKRQIIITVLAATLIAEGMLCREGTVARAEKENAAAPVEGEIDIGDLEVVENPEVGYAPEGVAFAGDGSIVVSDSNKNIILSVKDGKATVLAGEKGAKGIYGEAVGGYRDGKAGESMFGKPAGVAPYGGGWAVCDRDNGALRWISGDAVKTLDISSELERPVGAAADKKGNLYVSDAKTGKVYQIPQQGKPSALVKDLKQPTALCFKKGALYIVETGLNRILKMNLSDKNAKPEVFAGSGEEAFLDGDAMDAAFSSPQGIAVGKDGSVFVSDTANSALRRIKSGKVDTLIREEASSLSADFVSPKGLGKYV